MKKDRRSDALTFLAGLGVGAAVMYLMDPERGARRRALLRDQATSSVRSGAHAVRERAVGARNRTTGSIAELRGRFGDDHVVDEQLVARVRAELGHHIEHTKAIEVVADGGTVTLRGKVQPAELDEVIGTVRKVRGVAEVRNELDVREAQAR